MADVVSLMRSLRLAILRRQEAGSVALRVPIRRVGIVVVEEEEEALPFVAVEPREGRVGHVCGLLPSHRVDTVVVVVLETTVEAEDALHPGARDDGAGREAMRREDLGKGELVRREAAGPVLAQEVLALNRVGEAHGAAPARPARRGSTRTSR